MGCIDACSKDNGWLCFSCFIHKDSHLKTIICVPDIKRKHEQYCFDARRQMQYLTTNRRSCCKEKKANNTSRSVFRLKLQARPKEAVSIWFKYSQLLLEIPLPLSYLCVFLFNFDEIGLTGQSTLSHLSVFVAYSQSALSPSKRRNILSLLRNEIYVMHVQCYAE